MSNIPYDLQSLRERQRLFRRLLDGDLSPTEHQQLEDRLHSDRAWRAEYIKFVDLDACLHDELAQRPERSFAVLPSRRWPRWLAVAVSVSACAVVAWLLVPRPVEVVNPRPELVASVPAPAAEYATAPLQGLPDVAVVTALTQTRAAGNPPQPPLGRGGEPASTLALETLAVGSRLKPGILKLREGELQLDFLGGARLLLQSPAELHLVSRTSATLVAGAAGVRISHSEGGFVLNAPDVAIVDVGTEFAAAVGPDKLTQVHVFTGAVEISVLGEDGSTLISERLTEAGTVEVNPRARTFRQLTEPTVPLPRVRELDQTQLVVTAAYVREVELSKPYLYWRFDSLDDGIVSDALGGPHAARILADDDNEPAIRIANGTAEFLPSAQRRCIVSVDPIPHFNQGDLSLELWMMPTEFRTGAILGAVLPNEDPATLHLSLIELAHNTNLVHQPGVIRFLHRQPPALGGGYNLFSQDVCTPGRWAHVVATKSSDHLRLYVNGRLVRSFAGPGTGASDDLSYRLVLGQLATTKVDRQFHGFIDEVAIYDRELSSEEISRHYWSIIRPTPLAAKLPPDAHRLIANLPSSPPMVGRVTLRETFR